MAIQAVIFDLGGVLLRVNPAPMVSAIAGQTTRNPQEIERAFHDPALLEPFELGRISPQQYFEQLTRRLRLSWTFEQFVQAWNGILSEDAGRTRWLERLRRRYTVLVLTNTNVLHNAHILRTWPVFRQAHHWIASHEVGLRKPQPEIFELALAKAGVPPESVAYFDDLEPHIAAARRLGFAAVQVGNGWELERELQALGVQV